jgi:hypothetical protein
VVGDDVKDDVAGLDQPEVVGIVALVEDPVPCGQHNLRGRLGERVQLAGPHAMQEPLSGEP